MRLHIFKYLALSRYLISSCGFIHLCIHNKERYWLLAVQDGNVGNKS